MEPAGEIIAFDTAIGQAEPAICGGEIVGAEGGGGQLRLEGRIIIATSGPFELATADGGALGGIVNINARVGDLLVVENWHGDGSLLGDAGASQDGIGSAAADLGVKIRECGADAKGRHYEASDNAASDKKTHENGNFAFHIIIIAFFGKSLI